MCTFPLLQCTSMIILYVIHFIWITPCKTISQILFQNLVQYEKCKYRAETIIYWRYVIFSSFIPMFFHALCAHCSDYQTALQLRGMTNLACGLLHLCLIQISEASLVASKSILQAFGHIANLLGPLQSCLDSLRTLVWSILIGLARYSAVRQARSSTS